MAKSKFREFTQNPAHHKIGRDLIIVCVITTIIFTPSLTIDAFNPPKFLVMCLGVSYLILKYKTFLFQELQRGASGNFVSALLVFVILILLANHYSLSERIFGLERRNFGLVTVICFFALGFITFSSSRSKAVGSKLLFLGLTCANVFVSIIFLMQLIGWAFIDFDNQFGVLPSSMGNPNFLSAFIAISIFGIFGLILDLPTRSIWKPLALLQITVSIFIIWETRSFQGFAALALGVFVLLIVLARKLTSTIIFRLIAILLIVGITVCVAGMFGVGIDLTSKLPQTLLIRTIYWKVGFQMVQDSPIFGWGFDAYLDNFRRYLQPEYVSIIGEGVISDSPHNIFLDFFVSGGVPFGMIATLGAALALIRCVKQILMAQKGNHRVSPDEILLVILVIFLAISFISPFQLSLFIWLPVVIGLATSLVQNDQTKVLKEKSVAAKKRRFDMVSLALSMVFVATLSLVSAIFPTMTEIRYRKAVESGNFYDLKKVALAWPFSGGRAIAIAQGMLDASFTSSNSPDQKVQLQLQIIKGAAIEIANSTIEMNPKNFEAWRFLLLNSPDGAAKLLALENLHRIDPHNSARWHRP